MVLNEVDPKPMSEVGTATEYTAVTPPETIYADANLNDPDNEVSPSPSSIPWPDSTFIIRCAATGEVITVLDGQVTLDPPGGRGSIHWVCVETKGWLGFRNLVTGKFLGHDPNGRLICSAGRHQSWENFCVRMRPEGGYLLLMTHFERLWPVGMKVHKGMDVLAKMENGGPRRIDWEFIKI